MLLPSSAVPLEIWIEAIEVGPWRLPTLRARLSLSLLFKLRQQVILVRRQPHNRFSCVANWLHFRRVALPCVHLAVHVDKICTRGCCHPKRARGRCRVLWYRLLGCSVLSRYLGT